jgi:transcriptional regulator with XRE-family HTH domain
MYKPAKRPYKEQRRLKAAMKLHGLNGKQVAGRLDLSHGYVRLLLNGYVYSRSALIRIGKFVGGKPE